MRIARWLAVAALIVSCGDDDTIEDKQLANQQGDAGACLPLPCPSNAPWNQAACKCEAQPTCDLDAELALRTGANPIDCGTLLPGATIDTLKVAQRCVLDAAAAKSAFKLKVSWQGVDSAPATAYAGNGKTVSILDYDSNFAPPSGGPTLGGRLCDDYKLTTDCQVQNGSLCLECKTLYESSYECTSATTDCNPVGDYEVGKEGGYKPCCPGLREVFHQRPGQGENNAPICWDPPLRSSQCIQGRCGDGVCQPQEAEVCGRCTLDCPQLGK